MCLFLGFKQLSSHTWKRTFYPDYLISCCYGNNPSKGLVWCFLSAMVMICISSKSKESVWKLFYPVSLECSQNSNIHVKLIVWGCLLPLCLSKCLNLKGCYVVLDKKFNPEFLYLLILILVIQFSKSNDKLFSEGNKVTGTLFESTQVAGSATQFSKIVEMDSILASFLNPCVLKNDIEWQLMYLHCKTVWNGAVLEGQFVLAVSSIMKTERFIILFVSLLIKISST